MKQVRKRVIEINIGLFIICLYVFLFVYAGQFMWYLFWGIIISPICLIIADSKNKDAWGWYVIGWVLGVIGLVVLLFLRKEKNQRNI